MMSSLNQDGKEYIFFYKIHSTIFFLSNTIISISLKVLQQIALKSRENVHKIQQNINHMKKNEKCKLVRSMK